MILAIRLAASTSWEATSCLLHGGVDNWLFQALTSRRRLPPTRTMPSRPRNQYAGFNQNIRNGNSFFVLNTEIRLPVFRYLSNHPIKSDFLNNFQIVTFGDAGTAWTG